MINKANNEDKQENVPLVDAGYVDTAKLDMQCHLIIKDVDTGEVIVNKRG